MALKIIDKQDNPLLSRTEVKAELTFEGATPSSDSVRKEISKQMDVDSSLVYVKKIETGFGSHEAKAEIQVYKDAKSMKLYIKKGKKALEKEKKAADEKKKAEEEAAAKKAEEAKAAEAPEEEEKTEEKKE